MKVFPLSAMIKEKIEKRGFKLTEKSYQPIVIRNMIMPVFMIIWFPSWLWLILIPANFAIDYLVLFLSLKGYEDRKLFCGEHIVPICLAGFLADFLGAIWMIIFWFTKIDTDLGTALANNPYSYPPAALFTLFCVFISAVFIFLLDRNILKKSGKLDTMQVKKSALAMAIFTAPYLYLIPTNLS